MVTGNLPDLRIQILLLAMLFCSLGFAVAQSNLPPGAGASIVIRGVPRQPLIADALPPKLHFKGEFVGGTQWQDRLGIHYLVISAREKGTFAERGYKSILMAGEYVEQTGHLKPLWKTKAQADCCLEALELDSNATAVTDLDQNGMTESFWGYRATPDGEDPEKATLMLHIGNQQYTIHGQFAGAEGDRGKVEQMIVDPRFAEINPIFKNFAQLKWREFQQRYYDSWQ
jgi:hypothetical protein